MTFLEAAQAVLADAGEPLTATEITRRAIAEGLLSTNGKTPEATMRAVLGSTLQRSGEDAEILKAGRGRWVLRGRGDASQSVPGQGEIARSAALCHWLFVANP